MDNNSLNIELFIKAKEVLKIILKKSNVEITHGLSDTNNNIIIKSMVILNKHRFNIIKKELREKYLNINSKYINLISKKNKIKLKKLDYNSRIKLLNSLWYLKLLKPFYGVLYETIINKSYKYELNYNSVFFSLSKKDFDKMYYYCEYVYKIQQLYKLNKDLDIKQNFTIVFDDEKSNYLLLDKISKIFNDFI